MIRWLIILVLLFVVVFQWESSGYREEVRSAPVSVEKMSPVAGAIRRTSTLSSAESRALASDIELASKKFKLDPALILAVIRVESEFRKDVSSSGAVGLMQIMQSIHGKRVLDPVLLKHSTTNVLLGSSILKDAIRRGGGVESGLLLYNGSYGTGSTAYSDKVLRHRDRYTKLLSGGEHGGSSKGS